MASRLETSPYPYRQTRCSRDTPWLYGAWRRYELGRAGYRLSGGHPSYNPRMGLFEDNDKVVSVAVVAKVASSTYHSHKSSS